MLPASRSRTPISVLGSATRTITLPTTFCCDGLRRSSTKTGASGRAASRTRSSRSPDDLTNKGLTCEMIKYGEVKALLSGVTTIQGTSPGSQCVRTLIRNAENQANLPTSASHVRTFILDIGSFQGDVNSTATKSVVVHLAEGVRGDPKSLTEFTTLKAKRLLASGTAVIHDAAFGDSEFQR